MIDVMLIRGAPGSGKSTLGARLRRRLGVGAVVEVDQLRGLVIGCDWTDARVHAAAVAMACAGARALLGAGVRPVVIVDTFAGQLELALRLLEVVDTMVASLWLDPVVLARRVSARRSGFSDVDRALAVNASVLADPREREVVIDAGALGPDSVELLAVETLAKPRPGIELDRQAFTPS